MPSPAFPHLPCRAADGLLYARVAEQLRQRRTKRSCNLRRNHEAYVLHPTLNAAHVRPVNLRTVGEIFLRQIQFVTSCMHSLAKRDQYWRVCEAR